MNIQDWFPLELTGWISLQFKGLSRVFNTTVQKDQFFGAQLSLQSNSHIPAFVTIQLSHPYMTSGKTKALTRWTFVGKVKFIKRWEYQTTWPASWEICMQVRKQQLELDKEQQTGSKSGKEYVKAVYYHPAYLTSMQSTLCEIPSWMKHKLESRLPGEISITSDIQMTPPLWQKVKKN